LYFDEYIYSLLVSLFEVVLARIILHMTAVIIWCTWSRWNF